jgi:thioredoxin 1
MEQVLMKSDIVVLDAWAGWCGPCRAFAPIFEAASKRHPDVVWGKLNTEEQPELASALNVRALPTLMLFRDGRFCRKVGARRTRPVSAVAHAASA